MTGHADYQVIIDGSNVINHMRKLDGGKSEAHLVIARLESAISYFQSRGIICKIYLDHSTLSQAKKGSRPLVGDLERLESLVEENDIELIKDDVPMASFAIENGIPIVTCDTFNSWIKGKNPAKKSNELDKESWKKIQSESIGFRFPKDSDEFTPIKEIDVKPTTNEESKNVKLDGRLHLDHIRSRVQSLDDRMKNQSTKIDELSSNIEGLNGVLQDISAPSRLNSSAFIPCKFEDELGRVHFCLLGENLLICREGKWLEIELRK